MQNVMYKAQELAEAILNSSVYQHMHELEEQVTQDDAATAAIANYMEKRSALQALFGAEEMDPEKIAECGQELQEAEKLMESCGMVKEMRAAQEKFKEMMDNVNRILRLVVTGQVEDEAATGGCSGNCSACSGCASN